jgi:hypothetical protein
MHRSFRAPVRVIVRALAHTAAFLAAWSCGRTIKEEELRELVEYRIEPCRKWCDAMQSPDCGRIDEPQPFETAEECLEDCAAVDSVYGWDWAPQPDGTDACAVEWYSVANCMDGLTCEEQRAYFRRPVDDTEYPCMTEIEARQLCFLAAVEQGGGE